MAVNVYLLIAYDITSTRRRNRLVRLLSDYGSRVNLSVFECCFERAAYDEFREKVARLINPRFDSVLFYELCLNCQRRSVKIGCSSGDVLKKKGVVVV